MRADLLDAYAAVDWAISHLPSLQKRFKSWLDTPPYIFVEELHPEMGQKLFKLKIDTPLPGVINAEVGAVINSIRSGLDLLASAIAQRNGKHPCADFHFPIYSSIQDFIDPLNEAKRKKWMSERERSIIENLKPYSGGNDLLVGLHHLDITRKHTRLVEIHLIPSAITVSPAAYAQGMQFPSSWPGFKDDAVIAWTNADATDCNFQIPAEITFNEAGFLSRQPIMSVLRDFARMADLIIEMFE